MKTFIAALVLTGTMWVSRGVGGEAPATNQKEGDVVVLEVGSTSKPIVLDLKTHPGLMAALSDADDALHLFDFHTPKEVRVRRGEKVFTVDLKKIRADPAKDFELQPNDVVEIPGTFF